MLDDLKYIHQRDKSDALGVVEQQWQQLEQAYTLNLRLSQIENIVFAGMGGSALAALLSTVWPGYKVPFEICRDYTIPSYVSNKTLFIASSYSGNTEETLNALAEAEKRRCNIVVIASGGKLQQLAKKKDYPFELLPKSSQPRFGVFYSLKAFVTVLEKAGIVDDELAERALSTASKYLREATKDWLPDVPTTSNEAKKIAYELVGKAPVIYAGSKLYPAAYKWKISFNENAKHIAWCNQLPEFNHNEFLGWTNQPVDKPYAPIFLQTEFDLPQVTKRFEVSRRLLSGRMPDPIIINAEGKSLLEQLLWTVVLGDFISIYLALLNNVDPSPVDLIEKLKQELA